MKQAAATHHALFWLVAAGGAALDLGSKWLAFTLVGQPSPGLPNPKLPLAPGVFSITTSFNTGALWGIGNRFPFANTVFAVLSVLAALAILYWVYRGGAAGNRTFIVALGFIMAGTVGNCYDRIVWGKVRDFLYFELINWPIFNLADSCLVCGAAVLMLQAFFSELPDNARRGVTGAAMQSAVESNEPQVVE